MNLLQDIITYIRRIIKTPSNAVITDNLLIDYINRFWLMDVDARIQLFDLKTKYQFQTVPGIDQYNMPLYTIQSETPGNPSSPDIAVFPIYQGFLGPVYINGIQIPFQTQKTTFFNIWPNIVQQMFSIGVGDGTTTNFTFTLPVTPNNTSPISTPYQYFLRGHVDITGVIANANSTSILQDPIFATTIDTNIPTTSIFPAVYFTSLDANGNSLVVSDSGQFLNLEGVNKANYGLLMNPGSAPYGNTAPANGYATSFAITGASQANPCVLTCTSTFQVGQLVTIEGVNGMTQLNNNTYTVIAITPTTVTINVDSTAFSPYTSGGFASSLANFFNYLTGVGNVTFTAPPAAGTAISAQAFLFQCGLPRGMLFYNNTITLRSPPDQQYLVEIDAYLSPAAFFNQTQAIPFGYMAEYIARGAARKLLSDTGDWEQFDRYEPLFIEQEQLVWKRSQRQFTSTRTQTIYSQGINEGQQGSNSLGGQTN